MSDIADKSDAYIEKRIEQSLAKVRQAHQLQADGRCHFCDEPTGPATPFCDVDCRDDYEREQAALKRSGRS